MRLGLLDRAFQRGDLAADAVDGGLLGGDLAARRIDRDAVVAIVDLEDHIAGADNRIVARQDRGDMARHAGAQRGVIGANIGVVGRDIEAPDQEIIAAVADGGERQQSEDAHHDEFALAGFGRGRTRAIGRWRGGFIGGRLLRGTALGFFRNMGRQLRAARHARSRLLPPRHE